MRLSSLERKIVDIISPAADELGLAILWVEYGKDVLTVYAENTTTQKLTLDECTKLSREISPLLEVEDPIAGAYRLNISSPGIDRPLFNANDFNRYHDLEAKIELDTFIEGQKRFRGRIISATDKEVKIETDIGELDLPLASLYKAKLVMNDELIKVTKERFQLSSNNQPKNKQLEEAVN